MVLIPLMENGGFFLTVTVESGIFFPGFAWFLQERHRDVKIHNIPLKQLVITAVSGNLARVYLL